MSQKAADLQIHLNLQNQDINEIIYYSHSQGKIWLSIAERQSPEEDYTQHVIDLEKEDIQYICLSGSGIRQDISDGVGSQQCTVALPEAHGCMWQTGYRAPKPPSWKASVAAVVGIKPAS